MDSWKTIYTGAPCPVHKIPDPILIQFVKFFLKNFLANRKFLEGPGSLFSKGALVAEGKKSLKFFLFDVIIQCPDSSFLTVNCGKPV
jgi:hypothetical protein